MRVSAYGIQVRPGSFNWSRPIRGSKKKAFERDDCRKVGAVISRKYFYKRDYCRGCGVNNNTSGGCGHRTCSCR